MKNICKRCKSKPFTIEKVVKGKKTKYYRVCDKCNKKKRIFPIRVAFELYYNLCAYEAMISCKDKSIEERFKKERLLKKEYKYICHNLIILFEYIYCNNAHKTYEGQNFKRIQLFELLKAYTNTIDDNDCKSILTELLKNKKTNQE